MYNFCGIVNRKVTANRPINARRRLNAHAEEFIGHDLYERFKKFIRDFVSEHFVVRF